jgi:carboxymethylenebutenolidase
MEVSVHRESRRQFLATLGGVAGLALLRGRPSADEPFLRASLRDPEIIHGPAMFESDGQPLRAHVARPRAGGRHPLMLVNHGNTGLPEDVVATLARLAQLGYVAICFDTDTRSGATPGSMVHTIDFYRSGAFADQMLIDNAAAIAYARSQPFTDSTSGVGMLGFCGGGWSVLRQATRTPDVRAVVALYAAPVFPPERTNSGNPRPNLVDFIGDVRTPMQFHYGMQDHMIDVALAQQLEARLRQRGASPEFHYYADAGHAFCNYTDPAYYRPAAAQLAFKRIEQFLKIPSR